MKIFLIVLGVIIWLLVIDTLRTFSLAMKSRDLIKYTLPFERIKPDAEFRILVIGDSTAFGVGSEISDSTTAGRFGALYPEAEIINESESGLRIAGLLERIQKRDAQMQFDIILIQIGANDIIRFTSMKDIATGIDVILAEAKKRGKQVIFLHSGDVGDAPFFPHYLRPILSRRSFQVRDIYQSVALKHDASYVNLIDSPISQELESDVSRYYAKDYLHLSGDGYGLWFSEIRKSLP